MGVDRIFSDRKNTVYNDVVLDDILNLTVHVYYS